MATAAQISSRRKEDAKYRQIEMQKLGPIKSSNRSTIHGVTITINSAGSGSLSSEKTDGLKNAIGAVVAAGHAVPALNVYISSDAAVQTIAFIGNHSGDAEPTIFLGGRAGKHSCKSKAGDGGLNIPGGVAAGTASRPRGLADQAYDGTGRWFGNPKQLALIETTMIHEIGHVVHESQNPSLFWDLKADQVPAVVSGSGWLNAALTVSEYALKGPLEFVAEVFAGRLMGNTYSGAVAAAYTAAGGP